MLQTVNDKTMLTGKTYDVAKKLAQVWLPGAGALYFALAQIWGLPAAEQVVGTITAIDAFLGLGLAKSQSNYTASGAAYDGEAIVGTDPEGNKKYSLQFNEHPYGLDQQDKVTLKVVPQSIMPEPPIQPEAP